MGVPEGCRDGELLVGNGPLCQHVVVGVEVTALCLRAAESGEFTLPSPDHPPNQERNAHGSRPSGRHRPGAPRQRWSMLHDVRDSSFK